MTKIGTIGSGAIGLLAIALFLAFHLGLFAPSLTEIEGTAIQETPLDFSGHKHSFRTSFAGNLPPFTSGRLDAAPV